MSNDEHIIEHLKKCIKGQDCIGCPYHSHPACKHYLMTDALKFANKQQDDIDELIKSGQYLLKQVQALNVQIALRNMVYGEPGEIVGKLVRCKDCKHGQYEEWDNGNTVYCDGYGIHKPDWFCADGMKKDD